MSKQVCLTENTNIHIQQLFALNNTKTQSNRFNAN